MFKKKAFAIMVADNRFLTVDGYVSEEYPNWSCHKVKSSWVITYLPLGCAVARASKRKTAYVVIAAYNEAMRGRNYDTLPTAEHEVRDGGKLVKIPYITDSELTAAFTTINSEHGVTRW